MFFYSIWTHIINFLPSSLPILPIIHLSSALLYAVCHKILYTDIKFFYFICSPLFFFLFIFQKSCKNCSLRIGLLIYLSTIVMSVPFRKMEDGVEEEEGLPVYLYSGQYWPAKSSSWWWWWRSCRQCCGSI